MPYLRSLVFQRKIHVMGSGIFGSLRASWISSPTHDKCPEPCVSSSTFQILGCGSYFQGSESRSPGYTFEIDTEYRVLGPT